MRFTAKIGVRVVSILGLLSILPIYPAFPVVAAAPPSRTEAEKKQPMTEARKALVADIEAQIQQSGADTVCSVAFHDVGTSEEFFLRPDERIHPASTIKLALLAEVFHQIDQGKFTLDDKIPIVNAFPSSIDGSTFELSADDDGDQTLYKRIGQSETVRELARLMIVRSGNFATNLLIGKVTATATTAYMHEIGADGLLLRNCMMDMKAFNAGKTNLGTARGLCVLLTLLGEKKLVSATASDEMTKMLLGQEFNDGIPVGLPAGTPVAHKTGWISGIYHDAGIIYPSGRAPYVLVVMTKGIPEAEQAHKLVAAISKKVYEAEVAPAAPAAATTP